MRTPLNPNLTELEKAALRATVGPLGVDSENFPIGLTHAERLAAREPGLPARRRAPMEVKPGWKTSEFWLTLGLGAAAYSTQYWVDLAPYAGLSGFVGGAIVAATKLVGPLAATWLGAQFVKARTSLKTKLGAPADAPAATP